MTRMQFAVRATIAAAGVFLAAGFVISVLVSHYTIGVDLQKRACLPWRVYLIEKGTPAAISGGDVIQFTARRMGHGFDGRHVIKMIAGVPGDRVVVKGDRVTVNGRDYGALDLIGKLQRRPGGFDRVEQVPAGSVFVVGTEPRSYDSRYWGMVKIEEIDGSVTPIW